METIIHKFKMKEMETELHPDNMNREEGFSLSKSWKLFVQTLKEQNKALSKKSNLPSCFNYTTQWPFQGLPQHSSYKSALHLFPLPLQCHFMARLHPPSYWLSHISTLPNPCISLHLGPLPSTIQFTLRMEAARSSKTLVSYCSTT
jgi:hypothetical protein